MKALTYDRLVYYDIDKKHYRIKAGEDKGKFYDAQPGDYLIDIDTGKKLTKYSVDLSG